MRTLNRKSGFTLVELLVAMVLSGILAIVIYGLFDSASTSLLEVDSLSDTNDQLRFSMERIRSDVAMAGAQGSPDSANDLWVQPPLAASRMLGISGYKDWQSTAAANQPFDLTANPNISADGFIVIGAYDYPMSFELGGITSSADSQAVIVGGPTGMNKLFALDPFRLDTPPSADYSTAAFYTTYFEPQWGTRLLRLMDRQGYMQFARITDSVGLNTAPQGMVVNLSTSAPTLTFKDGASDIGIDIDSTGDSYFDAAVLDAYWYHVVDDPSDPNNHQLVRDRLCAADVVGALTAADTLEPETVRAKGGATCGDEERIVVASRVADFQIWFDCGTAAGASPGAVVGTAWSDNWLAPDTSGSCMDVSAYQPNRARIAHIRLSMHAETERKDMDNFQFEDALGNFGAAALGATPDTRLRTYDIDPDLEGAAPVVVMQTSVELRNYAFRNP